MARGAAPIHQQLMQFDSYLTPFTTPARVHESQLLKRALVWLALDRKDKKMLTQKAAGPCLGNTANQLAFAGLIAQFEEGHGNQWFSWADTTHLGYWITCCN